MGSPPPKKAKYYGICFWDANGSLPSKWEQNQWSILCLTSEIAAGKHYVKGRGRLSKAVLFHEDNSSIHNSVIAMAAIHECGFELIQHPPYSPDLAASTSIYSQTGKGSIWYSLVVRMMTSYQPWKTF